MLYIIDHMENEKTWHVGTPFPIDHKTVHVVREIQADGDELSEIYHLCDDIPRSSRGRVVRWFGDHARFVCGVLQSESRVPLRAA
jgi:hypothetical protein